MNNKYKIKFINAVVYLEADDLDSATDLAIAKLCNINHPATLKPKAEWICTTAVNHLTDVEWMKVNNSTIFYGEGTNLIKTLSNLLDDTNISFPEMVAVLSYIANDRMWGEAACALNAIAKELTNSKANIREMAFNDLAKNK